MATISRKVCDRCGRDIKYFGWTSKIKGFRPFFIIKLFNGNPDGYSYTEECIELCSDCTKALEKFMLDLKE